MFNLRNITPYLWQLFFVRNLQDFVISVFRGSRDKCAEARLDKSKLMTVSTLSSLLLVNV